MEEITNVEQEQKFNNNVLLVGDVEDYAKPLYEGKQKTYFTFNLKIKRKSGAEDIIPIIADHTGLMPGQNVIIKGIYESFNQTEDGKRKLILKVFAKSISLNTDEEKYKNQIEIYGTICKQPIIRVTPLTGKSIADIMLAVNRNGRNSDYLPCIVWGQMTKIVETLKVGDKITLKGRIQSREYQKDEQTKIAYEVSGQWISV